MGTTPVSTAIWSLAAIAVLVALLGVLIWGLIGDRKQNLRRCPKCWHDLSGTESLRCPECGREARSEAELHRRRKRYRVCFGAFAAMLAVTLYLNHLISQSGWAAMLPDRVMVWMLPISSPGGALGDSYDELGDRLARGRLGIGDVERILNAVAAGDRAAPVGTNEWRQKYGRLLDRWRLSGRYRYLGDPVDPEKLKEVTAAEARLDSLGPELTLDVPPAWPTDEAIMGSLLISRPWPGGNDLRVRFDTSDLALTGSERERLLNSWIVMRADPPTFSQARVPVTLGRLPAGSQDGRVTFLWEWRRHGEDAWRLGGAINTRLHTQVSNVAGNLLAPRHNDEMDALVRDAFAPGLIRWAGTGRRHALRYQANVLQQTPFVNSALGFVVEVLEDGIPRRRLNIWWSLLGGRSGAELVDEDPEALDRATAGTHWTLRITGSRALAVRAAQLGFAPGTNDSFYWDGVVEIPLAITQLQEPGVIRAWTFEPIETPRDEPRSARIHSVP